MICLICRQAEIIGGLIPVIFERGELRLRVNNVPARICPGCGEAFVDEEVAMQLLQGAQEMSAAGMMEAEFEFSHVI